VKGRLVLKNFRITDESGDLTGSLVVEDGVIREIIPGGEAGLAGVSSGKEAGRRCLAAERVIDGRYFIPGEDRYIPGRYRVLMPAFVDLHAHFRDPGFFDTPPSEGPFPAETLESACLAAAAGGFGTVVCMANTRPPLDTLEKAQALKTRSDALGIIDLYPVISLTKNMEGKELSGISDVSPHAGHEARIPLMLSEDGKDLSDEALFLSAMGEARRIGVPVSCHCDFGGGEAAACKERGEPRRVWSRLEENSAVRRAIELGKRAGCHIHIAHVSTKEAVETIRQAKAELRQKAGRDAARNGGAGGGGESGGGFRLTCEAMPHNIALTEERARELGEESFGRVNPPLRAETDRQAIIAAILDGTIDLIATDHAPHAMADKAGGAPGFSGLETAFAVCYTELAGGVPGDAAGVPAGRIGLSRLSALMSANPARILRLAGEGSGTADSDIVDTGGAPAGRGRIAPGLRADLVILDPDAAWKVDPAAFKTRGKNSAFAGRTLRGKVLVTLHGGRVVYEA
jgi:dihydroorotase